MKESARVLWDGVLVIEPWKMNAFRSGSVSGGGRGRSGKASSWRSKHSERKPLAWKHPERAAGASSLRRQHAGDAGG